MSMNTTTEHRNHSLISADRVEGTAVYNTQGEKLGHVEDVMLHKVSGKVAYAVVSCGGFLGMGEKYLPMPWSLLTYDTDKNGYVIPADRSKLEEAPVFGIDEMGNDDTAWRDRVHSHYNAPAYWV
jgi:sporulation protein YlmC with PRC-barrel domain